ncbi:MAG TPA: hypothetical protein VFR67_08580 [Pilimelia sp.]|nr:hypothetical protein [Pilimelia sp.]
MKIKRTAGLLLGGVLAILAVAPVAASAADNGDGPQAKRSGVAAAEYAPDLCLFLRQMHPAEQKYRNTNNTPFTYDIGRFGTDWFDVACGELTITVPAGQEALVDLTAVAELDCQSDKPAVNGWCGGRFLINGVPVTHPDNTGRADSYAWDSANGGSYDWQANTLAQEYVAYCRQSPTGAPCVYKVQLQSRLENGATSVWIDDLTMRVDVTEGKVSIVSGPTTP